MTNSPLLAFTRVLDPTDNVTGGGAASAVAGSMAAALVGMVARVSVGKKNMPEPDAFYQAIDAEAQALSLTLLEGSNADSAAFDRVMAGRQGFTVDLLYALMLQVWLQKQWGVFEG